MKQASRMAELTAANNLEGYMNIDQIRQYIAWGLFGLAAIPIVVCIIAMTCLGICALLFMVPALLVAPEQEMVFGHSHLFNKAKLEKGPWLS